MDSIIQQLYSRLSHSSQNAVLIIKPAPSFGALYTKASQTSDLSEPTNYSSLSEKVSSQISRRIINTQRIKQIGSFTYDSLSKDVGILQSNHTNLQQFQEITKHVQDLQRRQMDIINQLMLEYNRTMGAQLNSPQLFERFVQQHMCSYVTKVNKSILPQYSRLISSIKIAHTLPACPPEPISSLQQYSQHNSKLIEVLSKFRSILAIEYQHLVSSNHNYEQESRASLQFLAKLRNLLGELAPFISDTNCTLDKLHYYANNQSKLLMGRIQRMYGRCVHPGINMKIGNSQDRHYNRYKWQPQVEQERTNILDDWCMNGHYWQCCLQINKYVYIQAYLDADISSIQSFFTSTPDLILELLISNDKQVYNKIMASLQQCRQLYKWCANALNAGPCTYFTIVDKGVERSLLKLVDDWHLCEQIEQFVTQDSVKCLRALVRLQQIKAAKIPNEYIAIQRLLLELYTNAQILNEVISSITSKKDIDKLFTDIKLFIQNNIQQIQSMRKSYANSINLFNFNFNTNIRQDQTPVLRIQEGTKIGPHLSKEQKPQMKKSPKIEIYEIIQLVEESSQFFQSQLKHMIGNGFQLAVFHLDGKKQNQQDKMRRVMLKVESLKNRYDFDKTVLKNSVDNSKEDLIANLLRSETVGEIRIDEQPQVENQNNKEKNNKHQQINIDLQNQVFLMQKNLKNLSKILSVNYSTKNGISIVSLAEQNLNFQFQDWSKRIKYFQQQLKVFEAKCKEIQFVYTQNITSLFSSVYKVFKEYITTIQTVGDIFHQILFVFKNCRQLQIQRKGSFAVKPLSLWDQFDLAYVEGLASYKLKMIDEIGQLEKFNYIHRNARNYLKSIYFRFKVNFDVYVPYNQQVLKRIVRDIQTANCLKQNHLQIFQTFTQILNKPVTASSPTQIWQICKQISKLSEQSSQILRMDDTGLPIQQKAMQQIRKIISNYSDQFRLAQAACTLFDLDKEPSKEYKFSNQSKQALYNKIVQVYKANKV